MNDWLTAYIRGQFDCNSWWLRYLLLLIEINIVWHNQIQSHSLQGSMHALMHID